MGFAANNTRWSSVGHRADHISGYAMIRRRRARCPALQMHRVSATIRRAVFWQEAPLIWNYTQMARFLDEQTGRNSEQIRTSNIERPTSNVEYWWRYALSILKQANSSLRQAQPNRISKNRFALLSLFFKIDRIHYSMLDVQCSMFDVHFLVNLYVNLATSKVSFYIKLAIAATSGRAERLTFEPWT